ncbi:MULTISPECIES: SRPBCC family protein [Acidithrix]|uniref:Polyketide cyclase / dehydrase and lipid transport n=1 Tax=Acidithrix ferrooxidans TaxID=1280514 RepID=A0A0D8HD45_9ACTN|nr:MULTISPECIES: SRPBCC family protein [Acidithrix]KJF15865.1 polyketide cyclase / dehydrase and lipid transport [Acidithrix ferrooxidans]
MSVHIRSAVIISRVPEDVFSSIRDVRTHTKWMVDAERIEITSIAQEGVGLEFVCHTRLGPLRTKDTMLVTQWQDGSLIEISHGGRVKGLGRFELRDYGIGKTLFTWNEYLTLPNYLSWFGLQWVMKPLLRIVFQKDLDNLKRILES